MKPNFLFRLLFLSTIVMVGSGAAQRHDEMGTNNLQVEWLPNPQGIDVVQPRLSWNVHGIK